MKHEITIPVIGKIVVIAPTQTGKSILLARIEKVLREEFGAATLSVSLEAERRIGDPDRPAEWERKMVANTVWQLEEINIRPNP